MRIDWRTDKEAPLGMVVDLDTMTLISGPDGYCCFVDEETGEWKRYVKRNGKMLLGEDNRPVIESGKGRVKFFQFKFGSEEYDLFLAE